MVQQCIQAILRISNGRLAPYKYWLKKLTSYLLRALVLGNCIFGARKTPEHFAIVL